MRPQSIIMFERLFLASLAISLVATAISYGDILNTLTTDPAMRELGLGSGFLIGILAISYAIYLLLWYLIAHKASNVAKWILFVFVAVGVLSAIPGLLQASFNLTTFSSLAVVALEVAALVYLFRADAVTWLRGEQPADPATFD